MTFGKWIGVAAAVAVLASCVDNPVAPEAPPPLPAGVTMVETASGLRYADIQVGTGTSAITGSTVVVHYTGWLEESGVRFDTSLDRNPLSFVIGRGDVIPGWHEGVRGMRVGGVRRLVIPPHLAYGEEGQGPIPGGATLIFDVSLRAVSQ
jgi:FKBP-type peptidyl-prolyl cis-trans isomerase FkpA